MLSVILLAALAAAHQEPRVRLPEGVLPDIGMWGWRDDVVKPEGYKPFIDMIGNYSAFSVLTTTLRVSRHELTWDETHERIKDAADYARRYGIGIAMDLDVRLARRAFMERYPDELQGMLRLREFELAGSGEAAASVKSETLTDHYTALSDEKYVPVRGKLVRVYSYVKDGGGVQPGTLEDITSRCRTTAENSEEVSVAVPCSEKTRGRTACVMARFDLLTPDVFAPHLLEFQAELYRRYADAGLCGVCKDEWGFPPCYDGCPSHNDFWFSDYHAAQYARITAGRDLAADCLLMYLGEKGREAERCCAINAYNEMNLRRNAEIEDAHYRTTKEIFGKKAIVATHPTWWPNPDRREFKKNGLDWWAAPRDLAQVDEVTPYCVRTALAKKWPGAVWYNMFYSSKYEDYVDELWSAVLAGGRINYHPLYPFEGTPQWRMGGLLVGKLMRANSRVRLLNFITKSPVDSPVAVVFGHACAMNWAGAGYDDVGLKLTDALWKAGFYADLIPSSEIENGSLKVGADGYVHYGKQRYAALVIYHPEFEKPSTAGFLQKAAEGGTVLYQVGEWTRGFDGRPLDAGLIVPAEVQKMDGVESCAAAVIGRLSKLGIEPNTPASRAIGWDTLTLAPPRAGVSRMIDGMRVITAAGNCIDGDPIKTAIAIDGHHFEVDAVGVVGVRLAKDGRLEALAVGGLKRVKVGEFAIELPDRADIALWRDAEGRFHGVLQDWRGEVPEPLKAVTRDWLRLDVPAAIEKPVGY